MLFKIIDVNRIKSNIDRVRIYDRAIMAVVKADCYSNGDAVCPMIEDSVDWFGVAIADEGVRLRRQGVIKPILVLSYDISQHDLAREYDLTVSLSDIRAYTPDLRYHLAVDTGMNRMGVKGVDRLDKMLQSVDISTVGGIYSHIYDSADAVIRSQVSSFDRYREIYNRYKSDGLTHIASTGSISSVYTEGFDMVRLGIGLYEGAVNIVSTVLLVKRVRRGESVGYGGTYTPDSDGNIALCSGGYADGLIRPMSGGRVIICGKHYRIVGRISMDTFFVWLGEDCCSEGESVCIIDNEDNDIAYWTDITGISEYELMTGYKGRYKYVYYN